MKHYDKDKEMEVVGCLIQNPAYRERVPFINADDFFDEDCRKAFTILEKEGIEGLTEKLPLSKQMEFTNNAPSAELIVGCAKRVKDLSIKRKLIEIADTIDSTPPAEVIDKIKALEDALPLPDLEPARFDPDIFLKAVQELRHIDEQGLKTGFPTIDRALGAVRDFVTIAGNPGVGKTAIALQWAIQWAKEGKPILYYDFENSKYELARRILSNMGGLSTEDIREGKDVSLELMNEAYNLGEYLRMHKPTDGDVTPQLIQSHIRHFGGNSIVIIDSINKLAERYPLSGTENKDRRSMIDAWVGRLEEIKDSFTIPVIITSEVPKPPAGKKEDEVSVFSPKESGRIPYTSRIMFVLKRDEGTYEGKFSLIKNQFGEVKKDVPLVFQKFVWRIEEKPKTTYKAQA